MLMLRITPTKAFISMTVTGFHVASRLRREGALWEILWAAYLFCLTNQKFPQLMGEEKEEVVHWLCCLIQGCGRAMCTREWWNTWLCIGVCNQSSLLFTLRTFVCSILIVHYLHEKLCSSCISIPTTSLQPLDSSPSSGSDSSPEMSLEHSEELLQLLLGQNSSSLSGPELQEETSSSTLITSVAFISAITIASCI